MGDYIKIDRKILGWEWYQNINTKVVFLHCLIKANWKDTKWQGIVISRGSFVSSYGVLSTETSLTVSEVRTAIDHLKLTGEIASKGHSKYTVFTVNNYDVYQSVDKQNDKQTASNSQTIRKLFATIEEKEEYKAVKNPPISPTMFSEFFAAYPKRKNIMAAEKEYVQVLLADQELSEYDLVQAAVNYAEYAKIAGKEDQFISNPENFLRKGAYVDYLPGRYTKPQSKNKFNQFEQNTYDYAALEREILSN